MSKGGPQLDDEAAGPAVDLETRFDLLSNQLRRFTISILHESPSLSRHELTELVTATMDSDNTPTERESRRRIRIALHHNHLPRLADAGVIEYDDDTVTATPRLGEVVEVLPDPVE